MDKKKDLLESLDKSREIFRNFELEFNDGMEKYIDSLTEEQREYIVCWVLKKLNRHMEKGGSYRTMVYDLFDLPGSYMTVQMSGGLDVHNCLIEKFYEKKDNPNLIIIVLIPLSLYARNWKPANTNEFNRYCINNLTADPSIAARFTVKQLLDVCDCVCVYYDSKYPDFEKFYTLFNNPTEDSMKEAYNAMYDCTSFILGNPKQTWYIE